MIFIVVKQKQLSCVPLVFVSNVSFCCKNVFVFAIKKKKKKKKVVTQRLKKLQAITHH